MGCNTSQQANVNLKQVPESSEENPEAVQDGPTTSQQANANLKQVPESSEYSQVDAQGGDAATANAVLKHNPDKAVKSLSSLAACSTVSTMANEPLNNNGKPSKLGTPLAAMEQLLPDIEKDKRGYLKPRKTPNDNAPEGYLSVHEMYNMINSGYGMPYILHPHYILILDARDQSEFSSNHLLTARHHTAIDTDYDCLLHTDKLDQYNFIIVYDENSKAGETSETLATLCQRIKERHDPYILDGGIKEFEKAYPFLCTDKIISTEKERYQEIQSYPSNVLYGVLFQGNGKQATTRKVIEDIGITHVVNITVEYENAFPDLVDYLQLKFRDELGIKMEHRLSGAADYIADAIRGGGRVLVHCVQGISRSSTMTLSFLMKYHAWKLEEAYHYLKDKRQAAQPNRDFFMQLGNFERELFGEQLSDAEQLWIG